MHTFTDIDGRGDVTWYPRSGLIAFANKLYFVSKYGAQQTVHFAATRSSSRVKVYTVHEHPSMGNSFSIAVWFVDIADPFRGNGIAGFLFRHREPRSSSIWRKAQDVIRTWATRRIAMRKERGLAFAMGSHSRLGRNSALSLLPEDIVSCIIAAVTQGRHAQRVPHPVAQ